MAEEEGVPNKSQPGLPEATVPTEARIAAEATIPRTEVHPSWEPKADAPAQSARSQLSSECT